MLQHLVELTIYERLDHIHIKKAVSISKLFSRKIHNSSAAYTL